MRAEAHLAGVVEQIELGHSLDGYKACILEIASQEGFDKSDLMKIVGINLAAEHDPHDLPLLRLGDSAGNEQLTQNAEVRHADIKPPAGLQDPVAFANRRAQLALIAEMFENMTGIDILDGTVLELGKIDTVPDEIDIVRIDNI